MKPIMSDCTPGPKVIEGRSARIATWINTYGEEPEGLLTTLCGVDNCLTPSHLALIRSMTTHCKNGHEYTPQNTRWRIRRDKGEASPSRECKTCWERSKHRRRPMGDLGTIIRVKAAA